MWILFICVFYFFFFSSRRRHTRSCLVSWVGDVYKRQGQALSRRRRSRRDYRRRPIAECRPRACLLYTSDAADDLLCVDLGGRRIIKKKKKKQKKKRTKNK